MQKLFCSFWQLLVFFIRNKKDNVICFKFWLLWYITNSMGTNPWKTAGGGGKEYFAKCFENNPMNLDSDFSHLIFLVVVTRRGGTTNGTSSTGTGTKIGVISPGTQILEHKSPGTYPSKQIPWNTYPKIQMLRETSSGTKTLRETSQGTQKLRETSSGTITITFEETIRAQYTLTENNKWLQFEKISSLMSHYHRTTN